MVYKLVLARQTRFQINGRGQKPCSPVELCMPINCRTGMQTPFQAAPPVHILLA
jgi:hypothetical protein